MTAAPAPAPPRPSSGPGRDYRFPAFERLTLANGLSLIVAPLSKLPVVTVLAHIDAGSAGDAAGVEGVAALVASALAEGTARSDGATLAERFERLGTALDVGADWDAAVARLTVTSERLDQAVGLLAEVLTEAAFPEREIERLKQERLAELLQQRAEPRGLADDMFARFAYEAVSRYALPEGGTEATVGRLTRSVLVEFYGARYAPQAVTLILVGDVTVAHARHLAEEAFAAWPGGSVPGVTVSDKPARRTRAVHLVSKDDAPQSELRVGHVAVPRRHPDYFPIVVMNAILGGLFSSRINLNLREAHGYTYGAFSSFDWRCGAGPFTVATAVRSDVTAAAVTEILSEIDRIRADGVTESELSLATSYLDGVFPIRYETTTAIASALGALVSYGLPADYFDTYRSRIRAIGPADVLRAAREQLRPDELQVVAVGDPMVIRGPLEELALGPVGVYDVEGNPLA